MACRTRWAERRRLRGFHSLGLGLAIRDSIPDANLGVFRWNGPEVDASIPELGCSHDMGRLLQRTNATIALRSSRGCSDPIKRSGSTSGSTSCSARPSYFPYLSTNQSCVLLGGRGTGKTTVLKGLSYEGQQRLTDAPPPGVGELWDLLQGGLRASQRLYRGRAQRRRMEAPFRASSQSPFIGPRPPIPGLVSDELAPRVALSRY